ncbi:MAG: conserved hypothetical protein, membrane [Candidatus Syntrophoarchaeum caldarius]|uniref:Glycosyltransferase RgtA/B/C/D-like domain-containing protein n=1 Tax=Candidatus Syntropharchaeum caldarium TaxID=1838285 RepID=A0A1F2P8J6_9EURY|nr:MAG: conserved hypothetical protein, membrane [Candidatus Syntrophoarchaeum caldarius]
MKLSNKIKPGLFVLLLALNIILRFQVVPHEVYPDSVLMHIMTNSINEFGYARWFLHPLSIFGLYPASYSSTMQFLLSGISQCSGMEMRWVIFLYCIFIGLLSMFTAYLMAGKIVDDDLFKFLVAFGFSTTPAVLGYTTWTIPTRGPLIVLAPLLVYLLLKCRTSLKYVPLTLLLAIFLLATHHLFYFLIPAFFAYFIIVLYSKLENHINTKFSEKISSLTSAPYVTPFITIGAFLFMFSIPFFTGRFIEHSRYASIDVSYVRYLGLLIIPAAGGLAYLIFKQDKRFGEWFLLLTLILLTTFVYEQTYMKWFLPIFAVLLAGTGLLNILRISEKQKHTLPLFSIFLLLCIIFSGYYQFIHFLPEDGVKPINERYVEESTYMTGRWMKENIVNGSAISNDEIFGARIFATSETMHLLTSSTYADQIYGYISINISEFKRYPLTSEDFWFSGYKGPDPGEALWGEINLLHKSPLKFDITYFVENKRAYGNIIWNHGRPPSKLLHLAYDEKNCIYDNGDVNIWLLN